MALTGFLKLPDIDGESLQEEHENEIDVYGVRWGAELNLPTTGARRVRSRAETGPMVIHKFYDAASPYLADALSRSMKLDEAIFTARAFGAEAPFDYLTITLTNARIIDYEMHNTERDDTDDRIMERVEIAFEQMSILYRRQTSTGNVIEHEVEIRG